MIINFLNFITFPIRALFMLNKGYFGLNSLKEERMLNVAKFCKGKVLDIGCGPHNEFINKYIGKDDGLGVDVYPYEGVSFVIEDILNMPFENETFDTVTLIAVGGHIPKSKRKKEFEEITRILKPQGLLIMTEGEPITQYLVHKWSHFYHKVLGKVDVDDERGMKEDEEFCIPKIELLSYINSSNLKLIHHHRFVWGLNNVYVSQKFWSA